MASYESIKTTQATPYEDLAKPTKEPTNRDANDAVRPGPVDLRADIDKTKIEDTTKATIEYLDANVDARNRYSANNPHLGEPFSDLQTLVYQALRRYGDMHPGTVDGDVIIMFIEFANMCLEDLRSHPYWDNIEIDYYTHPSEHRDVPDQIMIAGLLYQYSVQQQSNKIEAYGPMYFRTMNRILYNRKFGNAKIEMSPLDRGKSNIANNRGYDSAR
jgi:hypothetical protein